MSNSPKLLENFLDRNELNRLQQYFKNRYKTFHIEKSLSRYVSDDASEPILKELLDKNIDIARSIFKSNTLLPAYAFFSHYEGNAKLRKHRDKNACTYTLDMCLYQTEPWDLYVEGIPYTLYPNQALAYYGESQTHWREDFPNPKEQQVAMIFFHYAEPDHWWFKNR